MSAQRIYKVCTSSAHDEGDYLASRLVRAIHPAQALRHVAEDTLSVTVATQDDLVRLVAAGVQVEQSGREAEKE